MSKMIRKTVIDRYYDLISVGVPTPSLEANMFRNKTVQCCLCDVVISEFCATSGYAPICITCGELIESRNYELVKVL